MHARAASRLTCMDASLSSGRTLRRDGQQGAEIQAAIEALTIESAKRLNVWRIVPLIAANGKSSGAANSQASDNR